MKEIEKSDLKKKKSVRRKSIGLFFGFILIVFLFVSELADLMVKS